MCRYQNKAQNFLRYLERWNDGVYVQGKLEIQHANILICTGFKCSTDGLRALLKEEIVPYSPQRILKGQLYP